MNPQPNTPASRNEEAVAKTDREWFDFCRPFIYMNGSHEMPNYAAICRAVLALAAPGAVIDAREKSLKPILEEMIRASFSEHDDEDSPEWTPDNRAQIDKWQCAIRDALARDPIASRREAPVASGEPKRIDRGQFVGIASKHLPGDMDPHNAWLFFQEAARTFLGKDVV